MSLYMLLDLTNASQVKKFNDFVARSPYGQVTQSTLWGELKNNWNAYHFFKQDSNEEITSALSIFTIKNESGTLAYATRGPVADAYDVDLIKSFIDEAIVYLPKDTFLIRLDPEVLDDQNLIEKYQQAGFTIRNDPNGGMHYNIQPRRNVVLHYQDIENEEQLMLHFKRDYRNQIRRAEKEGVVVTFGTGREEIKDFFNLYVKMAEAQNITHRPIDYFYRMSDLWSNQENLFRVYIAKLNGTPIASGIGFAYGDEIWYMYAGSDRDFARFYGPYAVQWYMIKWGLEANKKEYDFGGVGKYDTTDGLYTFKHGFAYNDEKAEYIGEIDYVINITNYELFIKN